MINSENSNQNGAAAVVTVPAESALLEEVRLLWGQHRARLGLFPKGAFADYAKRQLILGAVSEGKVVGYIIYRVTQYEATIVHLCVETSLRGHGIGRRLVGALQDRTKHLHGIGLRCRADYGLDEMWKALGFHVLGELTAKSAGKQLLRWWRGNGHPTLFDPARIGRQSSLRVAIDHMVFLDLESDEDSEAAVLKEDWLQEEVVLHITPETLNEIQDAEPTRRQRLRASAAGYAVLSAPPHVFEEKLAKAHGAYPPPRNANDRADLRHVAYAAAADVDVFITRDGRLLRHKAALEEALQLRILHPALLVSELDSVKRSALYSPARLGSSSIVFVRMAAKTEHDELWREFGHARESAKAFSAALLKCLADPEKAEILLSRTRSGKAVGLVAWQCDGSGAELRLVRCAKGRRGATSIRILIEQALKRAVDRGLSCLRVVDPFVDHHSQCALDELGFVSGQNGTCKFNVYGTILPEQLPAALAEQLPLETATQLLAILKGMPSETIERVLAPLRLADGSPCFVIPIQAKWATDLFDHKLAANTLFGAPERLAMSLEQVYYRSAKQRHVTAPGRVIWYVSQDKAHLNTMALRAASRLVDVKIGTATNLYSEYRRLGAYHWQHVLATARGDAHQEIMALRFTGTTCFKKPVLAEKFTKLYPQGPLSSAPQSPMEIPEGAFFDLLSLGLDR